MEKQQDRATLVRIHSQCLTGDVFHSLKCDCGPQLQRAMELIQAEGNGIIVYQQQEGRGIGIVNKIRAYALQDQGADTIEANVRLGFGIDEREYHQCAEVIKLLGARRVLAIDVGFSNWRGVAPKNMFQVLCRSINAAQKHRNPSWEKFADVVISPAVKDLEWDSFDRADQAIAAGREAMERAMPRLRELLHIEQEQKNAPVTRMQTDAA